MSIVSVFINALLIYSMTEPVAPALDTNFDENNVKTSRIGIEKLNQKMYQDELLKDCMWKQSRDPNEKELTKLSICVIEKLWASRMLYNKALDPKPSRRQKDKEDSVLAFENLLISKNIIRLRTKTDPKNDRDCLYSTRQARRDAPTTCYHNDGVKEHVVVNSTGLSTAQMFFIQIADELRFTFDYVLYDNVTLILTESSESKTSPGIAGLPANMIMENQFWYLITYVKELATSVRNPYFIAQGLCPFCMEILSQLNVAEQQSEILKKAVNAMQEDVDGLENFVKSTSTWTTVRDHIRSMTRSSRIFRTNS